LRESVIFVDMEVTETLVDNLANLSRLQFNPEEKKEIAHDLQRMIAFVEKLLQIDTTGYEPLLHMSDNIDQYRDDVISGQLNRETALANAPSTDDQFFKVPKVIRK
jgi:aspartyl-tRNA(Asn)/glutamyl-tRNA(Gln) amidotransferase subunit C